MTSDDAHDLECAQAALCLRIERAKRLGNRVEAREMRQWLHEIERKHGVRK